MEGAEGLCRYDETIFLEFVFHISDARSVALKMRPRAATAAPRPKRRPSQKVGFNRAVPEPQPADGLAGGGTPMQSLEHKALELQRALFAEREKSTSLKHELQAMQVKVKEGKKDREEAVAAQEEEVAKLRRSLGEYGEKVGRLGTLEGAVLDLCLEMQDRSLADDDDGDGGGGGGHDYHSGSSTARDDIERARILRRSGGNPLVILDMLRANLRIQLAFKDDYESELKLSIDQRRLQHEEEVVHLKQRLRDMQAAQDQLNAAREDAVARMRTAEVEKEALAAEHGRRAEAAQEDRAELLQENERLLGELRALQGEIVQYEKRVKEQDTRMMRVSELEEQLYSSRVAFERGIHKIKVKGERERKKNDRAVAAAARAEEEKAALEAANRKLQNEVRGFRQHVKLAQVGEAQRKARQAGEAVTGLRAQLRKAENRINRAEITANKRAEVIAEMKVEYNKLFAALNSMKDAERRKAEFKAPRSAAEARRRADANPHYASFYRDKLRAKDEETATLKKRLKRLLALEHRRRQQTAAREAHLQSAETEVLDLTRTLEQTNAELARERDARYDAVRSTSSSSSSSIRGSSRGGSATGGRRRPRSAHPAGRMSTGSGGLAVSVNDSSDNNGDAFYKYDEEGASATTSGGGGGGRDMTRVPWDRLVAVADDIDSAGDGGSGSVVPTNARLGGSRSSAAVSNGSMRNAGSGNGGSRQRPQSAHPAGRRRRREDEEQGGPGAHAPEPAEQSPPPSPTPSSTAPTPERQEWERRQESKKRRELGDDYAGGRDGDDRYDFDDDDEEEEDDDDDDDGTGLVFENYGLPEDDNIGDGGGGGGGGPGGRGGGGDGWWERIGGNAYVGMDGRSSTDAQRKAHAESHAAEDRAARMASIGHEADALHDPDGATAAADAAAAAKAAELVALKESWKRYNDDPAGEFDDEDEEGRGGKKVVKKRIRPATAGRVRPSSLMRERQEKQQMQQQQQQQMQHPQASFNFEVRATPTRQDLEPGPSGPSGSNDSNASNVSDPPSARNTASMADLHGRVGSPTIGTLRASSSASAVGSSRGKPRPQSAGPGRRDRAQKAAIVSAEARLHAALSGAGQAMSGNVPGGGRARGRHGRK